VSETKLFVLDVRADNETRAVSLRLSDDRDQLLGSNDLRLDEQPAAIWEALFDTAGHVLRSEQAASRATTADAQGAAAAEILERLGVFLGQNVLGPASIQALAAGEERRCLLIRFPGAGVDPLTSGLACIPWQIARPALGEKPLVERNLVIRVAPPAAPPAASSGSHGAGSASVAREPGEPLRVLLVFTEIQGGRPMAARVERERLRELFYDEIMPDRQVMLDILSHGVSRDLLRQKLQDAGGYHVIHWSGYGQEIAGGPTPEGDIARLLRGSDLAELLAEAGGFIPELVFLSAAHSGPLGAIHDWRELRERLLGETSPVSAIPASSGRPLAQLIQASAGCGETALELARAGVPQIVVTRHPAGSAYARRLARRFYRALLGADVPQSADSALALAQRDLVADPRKAEMHPLDHASAVVLGERPLRFDLERGMSPDLELRRPQPQPLLRGRSDLDPPPAFAGRAGELGRLAAMWLPKRGSAVALLHGAEGLGKTVLAAEAIHLWHRQFHFVIALSVPDPGLSLDDFYREIDKRLMRASPVYRERCKENEERRVFLPARQDLTGPERFELLRDNLVDVLSTASILVVIDGFEGNLGAIPIENGYLCADPEWDVLLRTLIERLADVSGSRVILTSRWPIASLAGSGEVVPVELQPLMAYEAVSLLDGIETLSGLLRGGAPDRELAWRILEVTAGNPVAMKKLGDLAREGRAALEKAFEARPAAAPGAEGLRDAPAVSLEAVRLEHARRDRDETAPLPVLSMRPVTRHDRGAALPITTPDDISQRAVALLLEKLSPEERNLLWRLARAPAPAAPELIKRVGEVTP
jgi:hypothetical protein